MRGVVQPAEGADIVNSVIGVREVIVKAETGEIHHGDGQDDDGEGNDDEKAQTGAPSDHDANGITEARAGALTMGCGHSRSPSRWPSATRCTSRRSCGG